MDGNGQNVTLAKETDRYELRFGYEPRRGRYELRLRGRTGGRNFSVHTRYNLISAAGTVIGSRPITPEVARFIFDNFEALGDTASFDIRADDLAAGRRLTRGADPASDHDVRHAESAAERSYTATGAKLRHHAPIFAKYRDTGYGSLIRATMTLHQVCASRCHYCSTILRNRADAITLSEAQDFITKLYDDQARFNRARFADYNAAYSRATGADIRLRGLILSGGGQPNLWPHFAEFVAWLAERDIDLGLITNGFPPGVPEEIYENFKWIRVSITPDDASPHYPGGAFERQYLPATIRNNENVTVGYSYVFGPWTDDAVLARIDESIAENGFDYCRVLADCNLTRTAQLRAHAALAERLHRLGLVDDAGNPTGRVFHQLKYHGRAEEAAELWDAGQCHLQVYNVFWDTTGHETQGYSHCYPCDSVTVLAEEADDGTTRAAERRFAPEKWGTVRADEVERLYREPVRPFFDPRAQCGACLFMRNNRTVKELAAPGVSAESADETGLTHVNFP